MSLVRTIQKRAEPYPLIYRVLLAVYGVFGEIRFFSHAVFSGKLRERLAASVWHKALSRQSVPYRDIGANALSLEQFRQWLVERGLSFLEGGWTIYVPPQEGLEGAFGFLRRDYPLNAGLKILKNFQGPETARYTPHRQHPAPGVALMRFLTPSAVGLIRIANYLYRKGLGIRIYDIIGLRCAGATLTCYVVEGVDGRVTDERDYRNFMDRMGPVFDEGDLTTAHARLDIIEDLMPPDCNSNLRLRSADRVPLYVDFQGFLFRNEDRMIGRVFADAGPHVPFDLEEIGRGSDPVWDVYKDLLDRAGCRVEGKLVMEIGCGPCFAAYGALSAGASWFVGWYPSALAIHVKRILLTLGATRFDLFEMEPGFKGARFVSDLPDRYRENRGGLLFLADLEQYEGASGGIDEFCGELPWDYVLCGAGWELPKARLLSESRRVGSDGTERQARVFQRVGNN